MENKIIGYTNIRGIVYAIVDTIKGVEIQETTIESNDV